MLRQGPESLIESQIKLISERVKNTEKYANQLRLVISEIAQREAELRDKYDEVSKICKDIAENEKQDLTIVNSLHAVANTFTMLADNKNLEAQRLVVHVESEFAQYGSICKKIKENLKECNSMKDPMIPVRQRRAGLEMASMDSKMIKTNVDTKRVLHELSDTFESFEQRKLQDFKSVFQNLLLIMLKANTSAIDPLTYSTKAVLDVDESLDLKRLKESFLKLNVETKIRKFRSRSMSALTSIFKGGKKPMLSHSSTSINSNSGTPVVAIKHTKGHPHQVSDKDDEDETQSESESESYSSDPEDRKRRK